MSGPGTSSPAGGAAGRHVVLTCEHGGNRIPLRYAGYFAGWRTVLDSHRGYDAGAATMARDLARQLGAPVFMSRNSRLLVDLNRSLGHPRLFSQAIRAAPAAVRNEILARYYLAFRRTVEADIARAVADGGQVIHVSSHSFTPELDGVVRSADIGLLYDPSRPAEAALCKRWVACLQFVAPGLKVRRNYPYAGRNDGFTAYLRRRFTADVYVGIELEMNQSQLLAGRRHWRRVRGLVVRSLAMALGL
ncbi:MAG: N-formylglutamate amidohydrolase [Zoogloea sp.]|nr:N-formylglutamate amidohydrolase [Zoogloea sp.]